MRTTNPWIQAIHIAEAAGACFLARLLPRAMPLSGAALIKHGWLDEYAE